MKMNVHADFLLSKIIEDLSPLTDNIDRLHRMGYINNFALDGDQVVCIESRLSVSMSSIIVDEVLEYSEDKGALQKVYLFAVHELKYRRKGIFLVNEGDSPLSRVNQNRWT